MKSKKDSFNLVIKKVTSGNIKGKVYLGVDKSISLKTLIDLVGKENTKHIMILHIDAISREEMNNLVDSYDLNLPSAQEKIKGRILDRLNHTFMFL